VISLLKKVDFALLDISLSALAYLIIFDVASSDVVEIPLKILIGENQFSDFSSPSVPAGFVVLDVPSTAVAENSRILESGLTCDNHCKLIRSLHLQVEGVDISMVSSFSIEFNPWEGTLCRKLDEFVLLSVSLVVFQARDMAIFVLMRPSRKVAVTSLDADDES